MTRVSSLAASNSMMQQIMEIQNRMFGQDLRVSSGKNAQAYTGIAGQSEYMINMENMRASIESFRANNSNEGVRQSAAMAALESIEHTMQDFRGALNDFAQGGMSDEDKVKRMQEQAFRSLKAMEAALNAEAGGRYLFSGSRVRTEPVRLRLTTLEDFQEKYNGAAVRYAETRAQHLSDVTVDSGITGNSRGVRVPHYLKFHQASGTPPRSSIEMPSAAEAARFTAGSVIHISDSSEPSANGSWRIAAVNGNQLLLETEMLTDSANDAAAVLKFTDRRTGGSPAISGAAGFNFVRDDGGDPPRSTITALPGATAANAEALAHSLDQLKEGQTFTVENAADPQNNGTYTVHSIDKNTNTITIESKMLRDQGVARTPAAVNMNIQAAAAAGSGIIFRNGAAGDDDSITLEANHQFIDRAGNPITEGSVIRVTSSGAGNGTFRITSISADLRTVTVVRAANGNDAGFDAGVTRSVGARIYIQDAAAQITTGRYYQGDEISAAHRMDKLRSYENDLTAIDPGIEKAIRAMSIIAQGRYGTEGGLDQNQDRTRAAKYLIESALALPVEIVDEPYGREEAGNIDMMTRQVGYNQFVLKNMEDSQKRLSALFANRIGDIENADKTESISALMNEQRVLQASMQSFVRLQQLSLANFL